MITCKIELRWGSQHPSLPDASFPASSPSLREIAAFCRSGGLETLFGDSKEHSLQVEPENGQVSPTPFPVLHLLLYSSVRCRIRSCEDVRAVAVKTCSFSHAIAGHAGRCDHQRKGQAAHRAARAVHEEQERVSTLLPISAHCTLFIICHADALGHHQPVCTPTATCGCFPFATPQSCHLISHDLCHKGVCTISTAKSHHAWRREQRCAHVCRRPGILVLINDTDWELTGQLQTIVEDGDTVTFISTLHGG